VGERVKEYDRGADAARHADDGRALPDGIAQLAAEAHDQHGRADEPQCGEKRGDVERCLGGTALQRLQELTDRLLVVVGGLNQVTVIACRHHQGRVGRGLLGRAAHAALATFIGALKSGWHRRRTGRRLGVALTNVERVLDCRKRDLGRIFALLGIDRHFRSPHQLRHFDHGQKPSPASQCVRPIS